MQRNSGFICGGFILGLAILAGPALHAQPSMRAAIRGGGGDEGKCTVEVEVDTAAQVEIRGDTASIRTIQGQPAQMRRFECTSPLPRNPGGFRFQGVDGRGLQRLVRDPRSGGSALIYIEDRDNGREGYTFDIFWQNNGGYGDGQYGRPGGNGPGYGGPGSYRFDSRQATRVCEDAVRDRAADRFDMRNISFFDERFEPGRDDGRLSGYFEGRRRERFHFSCVVDFRDRRIRDIDIDPVRR